MVRNLWIWNLVLGCVMVICGCSHQSKVPIKVVEYQIKEHPPVIASEPCPEPICKQPEPVVCPPVNCPKILNERKIEKVYYTSGEVFSETDLFSDRSNGFYKTYHRNGVLATEIRYKDGWQVYDKAFDQQGLPLIRNGEFKTYYANGNVASTGNYRNDLKHGNEKFYFYDGKTVVDVWPFMNGRQVGIHVRNDSNGNFASQEDWGYPTDFVRLLQGGVIGLSALVVILLGVLWIVFRKRSKSGKSGDAGLDPNSN